MVDLKKIEKLLNKHFKIHGTYTINSQGVVHVQGDIKFAPSGRIYAQLPVKFGEIQGDFSASMCKLTTFTNFPTKVSGILHIPRNPISSWAHAPEYVGKTLVATGCQFYNLQGMPQVKGNIVMAENRLTSLEGMHEKLSTNWSLQRNPLQSLDEFVGCTGWLQLTYNPDMPLLRGVLAHKGISLIEPYNGAKSDAIKIEQIINREAGKGKAGALRAALELMREGYQENARW